MTFEIMTVEVDGSWRNPVVRQVVFVWATMLVGSTVAVLLKFWRSDRGLALRVLALVYLATPVAQFAIGNAIYRLQDPRVTSVGFWGGPPLWIAPLSGIVSGVVMLFIQRQLSSPAA